MSIWFTYEDVKKFKDKKVVVLFSGGVDSMYASLMLNELGLDVHALTAVVGQKVKEEHLELAKKMGIQVSCVDIQEVLCNQYISKGILANAKFNGHFPLSSSYTRPAIAVQAVKLANEIDSQLIVHSSTPFQNSAARFNLSILAIDPRINIFCPAIGEYTSRDSKVEWLRTRGVNFPKDEPNYSVDENVWARVIENGTLDKPWIDIPDKGVFEWTTNPEHCNIKPTEITIQYAYGLPVALDGKEMSLLEMVKILNEKLGPYGIGRSAGLEDGLFGLKNPEIREAPAATLLHQSHFILEEMILSAEELRIKKFLDQEWTQLVALGKWFSALKQNIEASIVAFNKKINGTLKWRVIPGQLFCISKNAPEALYATNFPDFVTEFQPYTLESFYKHVTRQYGLDHHSIQKTVEI